MSPVSMLRTLFSASAVRTFLTTSTHRFLASVSVIVGSAGVTGEGPGGGMGVLKVALGR